MVPGTLQTALARTRPGPHHGLMPSGPFAFLSRRRLLRLGLGGAALVAGGAGGLLTLRGCAPEQTDLRVLSNHEHRTLVQLARACLPPGGAIRHGADDVGLAAAFDRFLVDEPAANVRDLRTALHLIEFGPLLFEGRAVTFSNLPAAEQLAYWQRWATADRLLRRKVAVAFRKFLTMVFFSQEAIWSQIGYPGPEPMAGAI